MIPQSPAYQCGWSGGEIHRLILSKQRPAAIRLIREAPREVLEEPDSHGFTPLGLARALCYRTVVDELLRRGCRTYMK
jgi:hypothetical protein